MPMMKIKYACVVQSVEHVSCKDEKSDRNRSYAQIINPKMEGGSIF